MPLHPNVTNLKKDTLLLNVPTGTESLNSVYTTTSSKRMLGHIMTCCKDQPDPVGSINNVYDLPIIEPAIRYFRCRIPHKGILAEGHSQWKLPHIAPRQYKNVNKFFPELEETPKGHMRTQHQGVRSTKAMSQQAAPRSASQTGDSPPNKTANSE